MVATNCGGFALLAELSRSRAQRVQLAVDPDIRCRSHVGAAEFQSEQEAEFESCRTESVEFCGLSG